MVRLTHRPLVRLASLAGTVLLAAALAPAAWADSPAQATGEEAAALQAVAGAPLQQEEGPSAGSLPEGDGGQGVSEALAVSEDAPAALEEPPVEEARAGAREPWTASLKLDTATAAAGTRVVATPEVSGTDAAGLLYNYVWERDGWTEWSSTLKDTGVKTSAGSFEFYPSKAGLYTLTVDVTDADGRTVTAASVRLRVTSPLWTVEAKADKAAVQVNSAVTVSAVPSVDASGFAFNFVWERDDWQDWDSTVKATGSFSAGGSFTFTPAVAGTYTLYVDAVDARGAQLTVDAGQVKVTEPAWGLSSSVSLRTVQTGQETVLSPVVSGIDTTGFTYNYVWNYEGKWAEWGSTVRSSGSPTAEDSFVFRATKPGTYELFVDAISPSGTVRTVSTKVEVVEPSWEVSAALSSPCVTLGSSVVLTSVISGAEAGQAFSYNYVWNYEGKWDEWGSTILESGSRTSEGSYVFTPAKSGTYELTVDVVDRYGATRSVVVDLKVEHDFTYSMVDVSSDLVKAGGSVTVSPRVSGNTEGLAYNYVWMKDDWTQWGSTVAQTGSTTTDTSWTFTPDEPGNYTVFVDVVGTDGVAETLSCEVAVWELQGIRTRASGYTWTMAADLGISNAGDFAFTYNYVYNQGGAWVDWNSTVKSTGSMTSQTSATYDFTKGGNYELFIDVVAPDGEKATASKTVVSYYGSEFDMWGRINSLSSPTRYLIACDTDACVVGVYERQNGDWVQIKRWPCTTGAWSTPTRKGLYSIESKGYSFDSYGVRCFWYSGYSGPYLFHSICYWPNGSIQDDRLGMHLSHGCIRLATANAKWIYDNVPYGTTVYVY